MSIAEFNSDTEVEILARAIVPENGDLPEDVAKALLKFKLDPRDQERVHLLAQKNQNDELSVVEKNLLERYMQAGRVLDLLRSKARMALRRGATSEKSS
jgi:hypothetical protein